MRNIAAIARREFAAYFYSPIAYVFIFVFLLISGYLFVTELLLNNQADLRPLFGIAPLIFCFFGPLITMRLFAEEKAQGTLEMLFALPVTDWEVVVGKFLAAMGLVVVMLGLTLPHVLFVSTHGSLDMGPVIGGYLGLFLMAGGYVAVGLMTSAWSKEQIVSAIMGFFICFVLFLVGKLLSVVPAWIAPLLQAISFDNHFQSISRGVIDTRDLLYYLSLIGICLLIAETSLESRRWR